MDQCFFCKFINLACAWSCKTGFVFGPINDVLTLCTDCIPYDQNIGVLKENFKTTKKHRGNVVLTGWVSVIWENEHLYLEKGSENRGGLLKSSLSSRVSLYQSVSWRGNRTERFVPRMTTIVLDQCTSGLVCKRSFGSWESNDFIDSLGQLKYILPFSPQ